VFNPTIHPCSDSPAALPFTLKHSSFGGLIAT
jgi:hypothetical protein